MCDALIVGAGPVGLATWLFLAEQGRVARLIEQRSQPTRRSRALAVNPRTLDLLASTGVTERLLALGKPILGAQVHHGERVLATLSFAGVHPRYPFMLALSQAVSEAVLTDAILAAGGNIERGVELVQCRAHRDGVEVQLESTADGSRQTARCGLLVGADGAHSTVRHELGIAFGGSALHSAWHLADVPLRTRLAEDRAHIFLRPGGGFVFLLRVVEDVSRRGAGDPLWRVVTPHAQPLQHIEQAEPSGAVCWESSFAVAHRIAATMQVGRVVLAGDAAHVHSPFGARGMNLGIEDAWVLGQLLRSGGLQRYGALRRRVDGAVVRRVAFLSRTAAAGSLPVALLRLLGLPVLLRLPPVLRRVRRMVTGLDHDLPAGCGDRAEHAAAGPLPAAGVSRRRGSD